MLQSNSILIESNHDLNMLKDSVKGLNENMIKLNEKFESKAMKDEKVPEQKDFKPNEPFRFLNDISKPKNLKPTETKIYEPEEEHKDLKDILRRRREDIEPDETEEDLENSDDEDWGEGAHTSQPVPGIKHSKVIKFKELLKLLK